MEPEFGSRGKMRGPRYGVVTAKLHMSSTLLPNAKQVAPDRKADP